VVIAVVAINTLDMAGSRNDIREMHDPTARGAKAALRSLGYTPSKAAADGPHPLAINIADQAAAMQATRSTYSIFWIAEASTR
jgi:hypothetical protein